MARPLLAPTLLLTLLFAACIGVIRARPYDATDLRAFLTPADDCSMPCFIGIRPGVTTLDEAAAILQAHEWVGDITVENYPHGDMPWGFVRWNWNGEQPTFLTTPDNPDMQFVRSESGVVADIIVHTSIHLADAWLIYGSPSRAVVDVQPSSVYGAQLFNSNGYPELGFALLSYRPCPTTLKTFWSAPVFITYHLQSDISIMPASNVQDSVAHWNQVCRG